MTDDDKNVLVPPWSHRAAGKCTSNFWSHQTGNARFFKTPRRRYINN